ncbi:AraC family transcriptional regulator [Alginatibacterium sediminis]|nr:AraC family transcriptional regulator [Alginatibacterium sediminis]
MEYSATYLASLDNKEHRIYDLSYLISQLAIQHNVEPELALEGSGIKLDQLFDTQALVSFRQKLVVLEQVKKLSPDDDFALKAGKGIRFSDFGFLGEAVMSSATLLDSLRLGIDVLNLAGPVFKKRMALEGEIGIFAGELGIDIGRGLPFCTEFWLSSIQSLCLDVFPTPLKNISLSLPYPAPEYSQIYREVFNCPIRFDASEVIWKFDATDIHPIGLSPNPINVQLSNSSYLNSQPNTVPSGIEVVVSQVFSECSYHYPTIDELAHQLKMSSATLVKSLSKQGTSYQQLLDNTKQRVALQYLSTTDIGLDEIARRLGYDNLASFETAFRIWTGSSAYGYR